MAIVIEAAESSGYLKDIFSIAAVLIAAALPLWFAAKAFSRQKEHELVYERYLQKGFDELLSVGEKALNSHNRNWKHALNVCKVFRDVPGMMAEEDLSEEKFFPSVENFPYTAVNRIGLLVKSDVPWAAIQSIAAFSGKSHELCAIEIPKAIRAQLKGEISASNIEICNGASEELRKLMLEASELTEILGKVSAIALEFELSRFRFNELNKFSDRQRVKVLLAEIQSFLNLRESEGSVSGQAEKSS